MITMGEVVKTYCDRIVERYIDLFYDFENTVKNFRKFYKTEKHVENFSKDKNGCG